MRLRDAMGLQFGTWTAICRAANQGAATSWLCRCDCGREMVITARALYSGRARSCGCRPGDTRVSNVGRPCRMDGCNRPAFSRALCKTHYDRSFRLGDPEAPVRQMLPKGSYMAWIKAHASHTGNECLTWPFMRLPDGRAVMGGRSGKIPAREMCKLTHGDPPTATHQAAHSCGKGHLGCVNPKHLRWATPLENTADKYLHGTILRGSELRASKLTEADVIAIRQAAQREPQKSLAARYGVRAGCISNVVNRKSWAWLP